MTNLSTVIQMLKNEQQRLTRQLEGISAALSAFGAAYVDRSSPRRGRLSATGRARIAAAQRERWAKTRAKTGRPNLVTMPKKRSLSAAARKKIAAAQRARWAKAKAAKSA
jgi:hypothetical protein